MVQRQTRQKDAIREALTDYTRNYPSQNRAAESMKGVSAATISQVVNAYLTSPVSEKQAAARLLDAKMSPYRGIRNHEYTKQTAEGLVTSGGRVLGVTATAPTLAQAVEKAYAAADKISFEGLHRRSDIGKRALAAKQ